MATYSIGEIAAEFDVTLRTLRFYEQRGLVRPQRGGPTRIYSEADRERIREVLQLRKLGFTVSEIRAGDFSPAKLVDQLAHIRAARAELDAAIASLEQKIAA